MSRNHDASMAAHACSSLVLDPSGWIDSRAGGTLKCYGILSLALPRAFSNRTTRSWSDCSHDCGYEGCQHEASTYCSRNAKPVRIRTQEENDAVAALFSQLAPEHAERGMWTALRSWDLKTWRFENGGPLAMFENWAASEPTGGACSVMASDGKWQSSDCSDAVCICEIQVGEWPAPPPMPPPPADAGPSLAIFVSASIAGVVLVGCLGCLVGHRRNRRRARIPAQAGAPAPPVQAFAVTQPDGRPAVALGKAAA